METQAAMPIAVVGMSVRFPGDATDVESFWRLLMDGRSAVSEVPSDRWNADAYYHPSAARQGSMNVRRGHFLREDIAKYDAPFFSMTKSEADATDPQQRLLLEVAYEAIENAGMSVAEVAGSNTSVYSACFMTDYKQISSFDSEMQPLHGSTGHSTALIANRISWFFDLRGPSITLDTGCSGSTVAFHLACQSLRSGEAETALACGVNLVLAPEPSMSMTAFNFLSPDGISYTFDHRASGYSRGEGFATIVLKPLDAAIRNNDTVRAVIRSTAVAQDGKTPGITLPSREAQASLIRTAYHKADLDMRQTGYFEAHGTGTVAGDAAELGAIGDTFGADRGPDEKLFVGSVKTNIGHLEGCAGLAGIVKAILAVERGVIPKHLHYEMPHTNNDLEKYRVIVPTSSTPWVTAGASGIRRASINCFGFGGTIAHVVLDDVASFASLSGLEISHNTAEFDLPHYQDMVLNPLAYESPSEVSSEEETLYRSAVVQNVRSKTSGVPGETSLQTPQLLLFSAAEQEGLARNLRLLLAYLETVPTRRTGKEGAKIRDLAYTLTRRTDFAWRTYFIATNVTGLVADLKDTPLKGYKAPEECRLCFIFTGQGAQWPRMGLELRRYSAFRQCLKRADLVIRSIGAQWSLLEELDRPESESRIQEPSTSQVLCTVIQTGLIDLFSSWGVRPKTVIGHSSGEIAAAYCMGALSQETAWILAYHRGVASQQAQHGAMMAVGLPAKQVESHIIKLGLGGVVDVACQNSPRNTTVSGDTTAIDQLERTLAESQVFARKLNVSVAYHSPSMRECAAAYMRGIEGLEYVGLENATQTSCRMFSSVTGREICSEQLSAAYFAENMSSPVRFQEAMETCIKTCAPSCVLELGPHGALQSAIRETYEGMKIEPPSYSSALLRGKDDAVTALNAIGELWSHGYKVDIEKVVHSGSPDTPRCLADLPPYAWNHSRQYWWESYQHSAHRLRKHPRLELLGAPDPSSTNLQLKWRNHLRTKEMPWMLDHQVQNTVLYPAAGMLVMVLEAARQLAHERPDISGFEMHDVRIRKAMVVPQGHDGLETFVSLTPADGGNELFDFAVTSRLSEETWQENCTGTLRICAARQPTSHTVAGTAQSSVVEELNEGLAPSISPRNLYEKYEAAGMKWGQAFQNVTRISRTKEQIRSTVTIPDTQRLMPSNYEMPHLLHPATFDAVFQTLVLALPLGQRPLIPTAIDFVHISSSLPINTGAVMRGHATLTDQSIKRVIGNITMHTEEAARHAIVVKGLSCSDFGTGADESDSKVVRCTRNVWKQDLDLFTSRQLDTFLRKAVSAEESDFTGHLCAMLDLAVHKEPGVRVLQLDGKDLSIPTRLLAAFESNPRHGPIKLDYTFTSGNQRLVDEAQRILTGSNVVVKCRRLDLAYDPIHQGFSNGHYNVLIATDIANDVRGELLRNASRLLKDNGRLLLATSDNPLKPAAFDENMWQDLLAQYGLHVQAIVRTSSEQPAGHTLVCNKSVIRAKQQTRTVILCSQDHSDFIPLAQLLQKRLSGSMSVELSLFKDVVTGDLRDSVVICLLDLQSLGAAQCSEGEYETIKTILLNNKKMLWVTRGAMMECSSPSAASILGLLRAVRYEDAKVKPYVLDLESEVTSWNLQETGDNVMNLLNAMLQSEEYALEYEFAQRNDEIWIPRILPDVLMSEATSPTTTARVHMRRYAQESLLLDDAPLERLNEARFKVMHDLPVLDKEDVEIRVMSSSMHRAHAALLQGTRSHADVGCLIVGEVLATGSAVMDLSTGDIVAAFELGLLKTRVRTQRSLCQRLPSKLNHTDAAAVVWDYSSIHHALTSIAALEPGERCLIVGGMSTLAQGAIQMACYLGAQVYAAVDNSANLSAVLDDSRIPSERVLDRRAVTSRSHGADQAWDVIICDDETDDLQSYWRRLADFGRLVHVTSGTARKSQYRKGINLSGTSTYASLDMHLLLQRKPQICVKALKAVLSLIEQGVLNSSASVQSFAFSEIGKALEAVTGNIIGSAVLMTAREGDLVPVEAPESHPLEAHLRGDATYVLVGGLGGIGRSIAQLLVRHGAKHLVFLSRSGGRSTEVQEYLRSLRVAGAITAEAFACDVAVSSQLERTLKTAMSSLPPVQGVINAAMVLKDSLFEDMSYEDFQAAVRPKIQASWNLHALLPKELEFFIMLSSVSGIGGMNGQANYDAGNTYQDALAQYRRGLGLQAVSIDLTVVLGVGFVAENTEVIDGLKNAGVLTMTEEEMHKLMKAAITGYAFGEEKTPAQIITGVATGGYLERNHVHDHMWATDNRFVHMCRIGVEPSQSTGDKAVIRLDVALSTAKSFEEAADAVTEALVARLAKALAIATEDITVGRCVSDYGVDSVVAVELRNWIQRQAKATVSIFDLMSPMPIRELASKVAGDSALVAAALKQRVK